MYFILFVVLVAHICYAIYVMPKLRGSVLFTRKLKVIHLILLWIIPFLWGLLLVTLTKKSPGTDQEELDFDDVNPNAFRNDRSY
jgi:hypothetical protein